jgi:hypothetical protein
VSHFFECMLLGNGLVSIDVQRTKLGFSGKGHDNLVELGEVEDWAIVFGVDGVSRQEKCPPAWLLALGLLR